MGSAGNEIFRIRRLCLACKREGRNKIVQERTADKTIASEDNEEGAGQDTLKLARFSLHLLGKLKAAPICCHAKKGEAKKVEL